MFGDELWRATENHESTGKSGGLASTLANLLRVQRPKDVNGKVLCHGHRCETTSCNKSSMNPSGSPQF